MSKKIDDYRSLPGFETKQIPTFIKNYDEPQGIVEHFIAIIGNVDKGDDEIQPGAFTKTIFERGRRVKVLDQHQTDSVLRVLGKPLALREVGRQELTPDVLEYAPDATGGLLAITQYALKTRAGNDVFELVRGGFLPESSIGYDAIEVDHEKRTMPDGTEKVIRLLREIRLWEYSNVIWGMNPATVTASVKSQPSEGKPWNVFPVGGEHCVFRVDAEGNRMGESLGCHDTAEMARQQIEALYASEQAGDEDASDEEKKPMRSEQDGKHPATHYLVVEDPQKPSTWHLRVRDVDGSVSHRLMGAAWAALHGGYRGNRYQGPGKQEAIRKLRRLYEQEGMDVPGKADSIISELANAIIEQVEKERKRFVEALYHMATFDYEKVYSEYAQQTGKSELTEADKKQAILNAVLNQQARSSPDETPTSEEVGPEDKATPTDELLKLVEIELEQISMEV